MFDQPPANLPVEPTAGPAPKPPLDMSSPQRAAASVPRPAAPLASQPATPMATPVAPTPRPPQMRGGMMPPSKQEPEDIFDGMQKEDPSVDAPAAGLPSEDRHAGGGMRTVLIVLGVVVLLGMLGGGGYWAYVQWIAPASESGPSVTTPPQGEQPVTPPVQELPPVVPPTPEPAIPVETPIEPPDIPTPTPVTPGTSLDADTDGDGLVDSREQEAGSDPTIADTDGDGLNDGDEVSVRGSIPTNPDSDADGLTDGDEVRVWNTNPMVVDTDGDGYSDGTEVQNGFNPAGPGRIPAP